MEFIHSIFFVFCHCQLSIDDIRALLIVFTPHLHCKMLIIKDRYGIQIEILLEHSKSDICITSRYSGATGADKEWNLSTNLYFPIIL